MMIKPNAMDKEVVKTKPVAIAQIADTNVDESVVLAVLEFSDVKPNELESIIRNKGRVIRLLPNDKATDVWLCGQITLVASAFGSSSEPSKLVLKECLRALRNEFKSLSIAEVWAAFRAHSAGTIGDEKGRGEMYGGKLTAKAFISVLGMWRKYKLKAEHDYFSALAQRELDRENDERAARAKVVFWPTLKSTLAALREADSTWRDCPVYIFDILRKNGLTPPLTKDLWPPIWARAIEAATVDLSLLPVGRGNIRLVGEVAIASDAVKIENAAKTIAKKIALFELVVKNLDFDFDFVTDGLTL